MQVFTEIDVGSFAHFCNQRFCEYSSQSYQIQAIFNQLAARVSFCSSRTWRDIRYKLIKEIGDGTFGSVLRAINKQSGEVVTIKKMKKKYYS